MEQLVIWSEQMEDAGWCVDTFTDIFIMLMLAMDYLQGTSVVIKDSKARGQGQGLVVRGKCYMDGKRIQCWSNA